MPKSLSVPEAQSHRELLLLPRTAAPPSLCPPPLAVTAQDHGPLDTPLPGPPRPVPLGQRDLYVVLDPS